MSELTTDDSTRTHFPPHGRITIKTHDNCIVIYHARGPFNEEIIHALEEIESELLTKMSQLNEHWVEVVEFEHSCLATLEALKVLEALMLKMRYEGKTPEASAFVFPPGLEGVETMESLYQTVLQNAGIQFRLFDNFDDALNWARNKLKKTRLNN